jgi:hypothetical protein
MNNATATVLDNNTDTTTVTGTPGVFMPNLLEALVASGQVDAHQPSAENVAIAITAAGKVRHTEHEDSKGSLCLWVPAGFSDVAAAA